MSFLHILALLIISLGVSCKQRTSDDTSIIKSDSDTAGLLISTPPNDYLADLASLPNAGQNLLNPFKYQKEVVAKDASRSPRLPMSLAKNSVLGVMRKNRVAFSKAVPGDSNHSPQGAGGLLPTEQDIKSAGITGTFYAADIFSKAPTDPEVQQRCIGREIPHYSDIMVHYYCQIPSLWRACHRLLVLTLYHPTARKDLFLQARTWATRTCLVDSDSEFDQEFVKMFSFGISDLPNTQFTANAFADAKKFRKYFKAMYKTQFVDDGTGTAVNVFDYIMNSQTYAFDWTEQNEVINQFYGEMMPASDGTWDASDITMCHKWRPNRGVDDIGKNYCLPETPKKNMIEAIGR